MTAISASVSDPRQAVPREIARLVGCELAQVRSYVRLVDLSLYFEKQVALAVFLAREYCFQPDLCDLADWERVQDVIECVYRRSPLLDRKTGQPLKSLARRVAARPELVFAALWLAVFLFGGRGAW